MVNVFSKSNQRFFMWKAQRPSTGFTSFEKVHTHTHPARRAGCSRQLFNAMSKYVTIESVELEATIRLNNVFNKNVVEEHGHLIAKVVDE